MYEKAKENKNKRETQNKDSSGNLNWKQKLKTCKLINK
jgi:hypothetical protein